MFLGNPSFVLRASAIPLAEQAMSIIVIEFWD